MLFWYRRRQPYPEKKTLRHATRHHEKSSAGKAGRVAAARTETENLPADIDMGVLLDVSLGGSRFESNLLHRLA